MKNGRPFYAFPLERHKKPCGRGEEFKMCEICGTTQDQDLRDILKQLINQLPEDKQVELWCELKENQIIED